MLAGVFDEYGICGAVMSIRYSEDILSIWNEDAQDEKSKQALAESFKKVLCLPPTVSLEYKAHDVAMKDSSSFRNTHKPQA